MLKPFPKPTVKPRRLPLGKRMTAILGFNCSDGILMMADTEETTSSVSKSEADKLARFKSPWGVFLLGGAGDAHFIDCATQEMGEFFQDAPPPNANVKEKLNEFVRVFFGNTYGQYAGLTAPESIAFLIAINFNQQTHLFRWSHDRVRLVTQDSHASVGFGDMQTHPMLRDVRYAMALSCDAMLLYGTKIMAHAKRTVAGVGGRTEAIALTNSARTHFYGVKTMQKVEELVSEIGEHQLGVGYAYVSGALGDNMDGSAADSVIESVSSDFREFRDRYRKLVGGNHD